MKHLLIIDLESTCFEEGMKPKGFKSEIIEIGAVILDPKSFKVVDEYQCFVKPMLHATLSDFCKNLTTITQEEVDNGIPISKAMKEVKKLQDKYDAIFCSWGFYDKNQFQNVCDMFKITYPFGDKHVSIKHNHGKFYNKRPMGMEKALEKHKIPLDGTHHRGIDDARNIAKIATVMIQDGWNHQDLK